MHDLRVNEYAQSAFTAAALPPAAPLLAVSIHDVAPATWDGCRRVLAAVHEVADIPLTWLIVPHYRGVSSAQYPRFVRRMHARVAVGDELALHGWTHVDPGRPWLPVDWVQRRVYCDGEAEFCSLAFSEACRRIERGIAWFEMNEWPLNGFVAPAWLLGRHAARALQAVNQFAYTTTLHHVFTLKTARRHYAPCIAYSARSAWRREASRRVTAAVARFAVNAPVVRFALHPYDADDSTMRRAWQDLLATLLARRGALTKMAAFQSAFGQAAPAEGGWNRHVPHAAAGVNARLAPSEGASPFAHRQ